MASNTPAKLTATPTHTPQPPPPPPLYSIALSLSTPNPSSSSSHRHPPPSILDPQHFPALSPPAGQASETDRRQGAWTARSLAGSLAGATTVDDDGDDDGAPRPQQQQQQQHAHTGRHGPIQVEWVDLPARPAPAASADSTTPTSAHPPPPPPTSSEDAPRQPTSGTLDLPAGTIHLYRHANGSSVARPSGSSTASSSAGIYTTAEVELSSEEKGSNSASSTLLAVLAVPSYFSPSDFLAYVAPLEPQIEHLRLIRDVSPSRAIVLVQMRSADGARTFGETFNGRAFNAFEPERCHVVPILHVLTHFSQPSSTSSSSSAPVVDPHPFPVGFSSERRPPVSAVTAGSASGGGWQGEVARGEGPLDEAVELPTCPVCLERMDSSVTGLVTVPCLHTYHCACLRKWGDSDSRCPVCRYSSKPLSLPPLPRPSRSPSSSSTAGPSTSRLSEHPHGVLSTCAQCPATESLWACLICGNVGCGRYSEGKHAQAHYANSGHRFALELDTQRCWNYASDEYVHRIVMDKSSGSLVELPSTSSPTTSSTAGPPRPNQPSATAAELPFEQKLEALALEYSYVLAGQLAEQRAFYASEREALERRVEELEARLAGTTERERDRVRIGRLEKELRGEREMAAGLVRNVGEWQRKAEGWRKEREGLEGRLREKEEELRDVLFYLEARDKIDTAEKGRADGDGDNGDDGQADDGGGALAELKGGTVVLPPSTPRPGEVDAPAASAGGAGKNKKKKKKRKGGGGGGGEAGTGGEIGSET